MKTYFKKLYQGTRNLQIFTSLFASLFLLFSFKPARDNGGPKEPQARKELKVEGNFQNIRIDGNISLVMLTNEPAGTVILEGKEKILNRIRYNLKNDTLLIEANRIFSFPKLTVYLSARDIQAMQVNGDTNISSSDFIKSDKLHISLNGNINVKVKTMGKLSFDTPENFELLYRSPLLGKAK